MNERHNVHSVVGHASLQRCSQLTCVQSADVMEVTGWCKKNNRAACANAWIPAKTDTNTQTTAGKHVCYVEENEGVCVCMTVCEE